jgi:phage-related protein
MVRFSMEHDLKRIHAYFYRTPAGNEPVREWLNELSSVDRKTIGTDVKDVEYAWPLGMPLVDSLGRGVWEVRSTIADGIARVIFCVEEDQMILLHAFVKKTRKTPDREIALAYNRMRKGV